MIQWISENKKWLFSGAGLSISVFLINLIVSPLCSSAITEKKLPSSEEFQSLIAGCAMGADIEIKADLLGSIKEIYEGDKTTGRAIISSQTEFLKQIPEKDRLTAYELYTKCITKIISESNTTSSVPENIYYDNSTTAGRDVIQKQEAPSYRNATIAHNDQGNPIGIAGSPTPFNKSIELLGKLAKGENVDIAEAYNASSKFLINSGTEISILPSSNSSVRGFLSGGFAEFVKIKILEGAHRNETGWIHASQIKTENKIITDK